MFNFNTKNVYAVYINDSFQKVLGCNNTLENKNVQELACCNYQFSLTWKTFKNSTLVLKKTVVSLLFCVNRFSQTSPKCVGVSIEKVFFG